MARLAPISRAFCYQQGRSPPGSEVGHAVQAAKPDRGQSEGAAGAADVALAGAPGRGVEDQQDRGDFVPDQFEVLSGPLREGGCVQV